MSPPDHRWNDLDVPLFPDALRNVRQSAITAENEGWPYPPDPNVRWITDSRVSWEGFSDEDRDALTITLTHEWALWTQAPPISPSPTPSPRPISPAEDNHDVASVRARSPTIPFPEELGAAVEVSGVEVENLGEASGVQRTPTPPPFELPPIATLQVSSEVAPEEEVDMLDDDPGSEAVAGPSSRPQEKADLGTPEDLFLPSPSPREPSLPATSEDDVPLPRPGVSRGSKRRRVASSDAEGEPSGEVQGDTPAKLIVRIPARRSAVARSGPSSGYAFAPVVLTGTVRCCFFHLGFPWLTLFLQQRCQRCTKRDLAQCVQPKPGQTCRACDLEHIPCSVSDGRRGPKPGNSSSSFVDLFLS